VAVFANASAEFMMAAFAVFGGLLDVLMPQWIQANQRHPAAEVLVTVSSAGLESWLDVAALGPADECLSKLNILESKNERIELRCPARFQVFR